MTEKLSPIERALVAASAMPAHDARRVLMMICNAGMTTGKPVVQTEPTEGEKHYAKREKFIRRMKSSCDRVLDYAKHETLRKIEKHFRDHSAISSAESGDAPTEPRASLAARLTFDRSAFGSELLAALAEDQESALGTAGQQLFDEIGRDSVWRLPSQDAVQFVQDRANLLANVPDEVHAEIMQSIEQGLQHGESRKELMARISAAFDEIGRSRAETIANTETAAAFNYARDKAMREAGVTHKKWLHSQSPLIKEPRPTHLEADGQTVPIDEPFDVGGVQFMRPADDSLGAGPEDIINCHCVAIPVEAPIESAGEKEGHPFRGNQWTGGKGGEGEADFKTWFGKSKVVDSDGNPLIVYRGDRIGKTSFTGTEDKTNYIQGNVFFSDNPSIGKFYTPHHRTNSYVTADELDSSHGLYRAHLSIQNPLVVDAKGEDWDRIPYKGKTIQIDDLAVSARKSGHDGLIVKNVFDQAGDGTQFVAFHPKQIRLAVKK